MGTWGRKWEEDLTDLSSASSRNENITIYVQKRRKETKHVKKINKKKISGEEKLKDRK